MKIKMVPKDATCQYINFDDVECFYFDYGAFHIVFDDGSIRTYPGRHIWYVEQLA